MVKLNPLISIAYLNKYNIISYENQFKLFKVKYIETLQLLSYCCNILLKYNTTDIII